MQESFRDEYGAEELAEMVRDRLAKMKAGKLRSFADEHGIDISGLEDKADLVDAITLHPGIARILGLEQEWTEEGVAESSLEEVEEEAWEEPESEAETQDLTERVEHALKASIDFTVLEHFLSEAATKFGERSYDSAVQTAKDSVLKIEEKVRDYVEAGWAFALASTQHILETSKRNTKAAKEAKRRLKEAREVFKDGSFVRSPEMLEQLSAAALNLYSHEMERAREHVAAQTKALEETQAMGGDITMASTMLAKAAHALDENHRASYLDVIKDVNEFVSKAREARIEEMNEVSESIAATIEEARSIGGDVDGASNLLGDVRSAIDGGDFIAANDLIGRAEQAALESQKSQIDRVAQMRDRQIERAKELIAKIKPVIDEARTAGFDAKEALADLKAAVEDANAGDYMNALVKAKKAYKSVKEFRSQMDAKRLEEAPAVVLEPKEPVEARREEAAEAQKGELHEVRGGTPEEAKPQAKEAQICIHCGSENLQIGRRGRARCLDCNRRYRI